MPGVGGAGTFAGPVAPALAKSGVKICGLAPNAKRGDIVRKHGAAVIAIGDLRDWANLDAALKDVEAWADPNFSAAVRATGRRKLIMAAVTTDICLIFPAISAVQEGFDVLAVLDASGSSYEVQETLARRRMEDAGVVLTTTNTAIAELVQDWSTSQGSELIQLLMATVPKV